jgi:hypothetical protein
VQSTVGHEVSDLLVRGVAATSTEFRCDADFLADRMKQGLMSIKLEFLGGQPLPVEPKLCQVVPPAVDLNLDAARRNLIDIYGYDFDHVPISVVLMTGAGESDVTHILDRPTHYHLTLNLDSRLQIPADAQRFELRWDAGSISTVGVLQPEPDVCGSKVTSVDGETYSLTPLRTRGDDEFGGHGPDISASVRLENHRDRVDAVISMVARETSSDWSTAEGTETVTVYTADPGYAVTAIVTPTSDAYAYTDTDHGDDEFPGDGLVKQWTFIGDTDGDDIKETRVDLTLRNIRLEITEDRGCVPARVVRELAARNLLAPRTLEIVRELPAMRSLDLPPDVREHRPR